MSLRIIAENCQLLGKKGLLFSSGKKGIYLTHYMARWFRRG